MNMKRLNLMQGGACCSPDRTYSEENIRDYHYNEFRRGKTVKKGDKRCEKRKGDMYKGAKGDMRGEWRYIPGDTLHVRWEKLSGSHSGKQFMCFRS